MLTPEKFEEWGYYYALEPWGMEADDFRHGTILDVMAKLAGAKSFDPWALTVGESRARARAEARGDEPTLDHLLGVH